MKHLFHLVSLSAFIALLSSCDDSHHNHTTQLYNKDDDSVVTEEYSTVPAESRIAFDNAPLLAREQSISKNFPTSSNELAFDLYKNLAATETNLTFSPLSISAALAMVYVGSQSTTEQALKNVLHFGDNSVDFHKSFGDFTLLLANKDRSGTHTKMEIANVLWVQEGYALRDNFKNTLADAYKALPVALNFKTQPGLAKQTINQTISSQTHGEIPQLLKGELAKETRLILTNALYFTSHWQNTFIESNSNEGLFKTLRGNAKNTIFMRQTDRFYHGEDEHAQFLVMPYEDKDFAALFVLPREGKFASVESSLNLNSFTHMLESLESQKVNVHLPKFAHRTLPDVKRVLESLGMGIAFDPKEADFSGISDDINDNFYIGNIVHEAVVKIYEEGTTAAAATAIMMYPTASIPPAPERIINFHADRPFLFFIFHQPSRTILFMGRVDEPHSDE